MKNKYLLLLIFVAFVSCQNNVKKSFKEVFTSSNYEKDIIGNWVIESAIEYSNGVEKELDIKEMETIDFGDGEKTKFLKNERLMGSIQNPKYYKFTKYNEVYVYDKNKSYEIVSRYKVDDDNITCFNIKLKNTEILKIISLNDNKLILKQEMGCFNCDKNDLRRRTIWKFYFRKVPK